MYSVTDYILPLKFTYAVSNLDYARSNEWERKYDWLSHSLFEDSTLAFTW
jgi:hypothetical protein